MKKLLLFSLCFSLGLSPLAQTQIQQTPAQASSEQQIKAFIDAADKLPKEEKAILKQALETKDEASFQLICDGIACCSIIFVLSICYLVTKCTDCCLDKKSKKRLQAC